MYRATLLKTTHFLYKIAIITDQRLKQLSKLPSFAARIKFCNENFKKLQAGTARIAYEYSPELVIKLAKNEKGIQQNDTESDYGLHDMYPELLTNVIDSDNDNNYWLLAERAKKITPTEFKAMAGFSLNDLHLYLVKKLLYPKRPPFLIPEESPIPNEELLNNSELVSSIMDMSINFSMPMGDFVKISSWGKIGNRLVLLDYGVTNDILETHYRRK
jgi:hypothetical protein